MVSWVQKKKNNPLANQLAKLNLDLRDAAPRDSQPREPVRDTSAPPREQLSDEELFLRAIDEMDPARIYDGKYRGDPGADLPEVEPPVEGPPAEGGRPKPAGDDLREAKQKVGEVRDAALFRRMVGSVNPVDDRAKYHHHRGRRKVPAEEDRPPIDPTEKLTTPLLPKDGPGLHEVPPLDRAQRELLQRYKRATRAAPAPAIHLRGDKRDEALVELARFTDKHYRRDTPFIRIIHGRGLRSSGAPVLKPAVLTWLEGPGLKMICGYVPERTRGGDYGCLIVELE